MKRRRRSTVAATVGLALLLAACGDDPESPSDDPGVEDGATDDATGDDGGDAGEGPGDETTTSYDEEDEVPPWAGGPPAGAEETPPEWFGDEGGLQLASGPLTEDAVPPPFTCDGPHETGKHPPVQWQGVPDGTAVLALVLSDPDAPGGTFLHWNVSNIDPALGEIQALEDDAPDAVEGANDQGEGYYGPCPPQGEQHTYELTLYALPEAMEPPAGSADEVRAAYADAALAEATLTFTYAR